MQAHPAAELFPMMEGAEFQALVDDIKAHGQRDPIIIHEGKILDGRNRYRACEAASREPVTVEWDGEGEVIQYVVSKNLHRRHLNESQRAVVAAKLVNMPHGGAIYRKPNSSIENISTTKAAELLNVSRSTVQEARTVLDRGTPEEIASVVSGEVAASTIGRQIRRGESAADRQQKRSSGLSSAGRNPERIQRQQINAEIWGRVRDALTHLTSLPAASDVAAIAGANDRTGLVEARLQSAINWLGAFQAEWSKRNAA